jgi:hypothetical protein
MCVEIGLKKIRVVFLGKKTCLQIIILLYSPPLVFEFLPLWWPVIVTAKFLPFLGPLLLFLLLLSAPDCFRLGTPVRSRILLVSNHLYRLERGLSHIRMRLEVDLDTFRTNGKRKTPESEGSPKQISAVLSFLTSVL